MISRGVRLVGARICLVAGLVLVAVVVAVVIAAVAVGSVDAYRVTHGSGVEGEFIPERQHCTQGHGRRSWHFERCSWRGTFTSDDGSVVLVDAELRDDLGTSRGDGRPPPVSPAYVEDRPDVENVHRPADWWGGPLLVVPTVVVAGAVLARRLLRWYRKSWRPAESRHRAEPSAAQIARRERTTSTSATSTPTTLTTVATQNAAE